MLYFRIRDNSLYKTPLNFVISVCFVLFLMQKMLLTGRSLSKVLQLTLAVIKPDAVAHPLMLEVRSHYFPLHVPKMHLCNS